MSSLDPSNFGIFADSEALGSLDEVETQVAPEYYAKIRHCEVCSRRKECRIPWVELYCLQYGVFPQQAGQMMQRPDLFPTRWMYNQKFQCFHPEYRCGCDPRAMVLFDITPTEAERILNQAARNGVISQQQQQMIRAVVPVVQAINGRQAQMNANQQMQQMHYGPGPGGPSGRGY